MLLDKMKPEKIVECKILAKCYELGWSVDIIDSKGQWSPRARRFLKSKAAPDGFADICGNTSEGRAVFIELKRPGVRQVRQKQKEFLVKKINTGCIAGPIRSSEELMKLKDMNKIEMLAWLDSFSVKIEIVRKSRKIRRF
jgi:hypothetical protein